MQRKGNKHVLFKRFECSSCQHFIQAYKYKRVVRIGKIKDGNYMYFIAQADLHFGELVISIMNYR